MNLSRLRRGLVQPLADGLSRPLARSGLSANMLTVLGLLTSLGVGLLAYLGELLAAGLLLVAAGVLDLLDGAVARRRGQATRLGALLDSTLDRVGEAAVFFGILLFFLQRDNDVGAALALAALAASYLVSYIKARGEGLGLDCPVGFFTRPERVIVLILGLLVGQLTVALGLIAILSLATAAQRFFYLRRADRG
ncbi:MAG: CDP-alcohol phosphatidyltransferase family protein [Chloroflexota bacterium]